MTEYRMSAGEFNRLVPVGTVVNYHPIINRPECGRATIASPAWALGNGEQVVRLEQKPSFVTLEALSFDCEWCKEAGCDEEEYRHPISECGGYTEKDDVLILVCEDCADAAREVGVDD